MKPVLIISIIAALAIVSSCKRDFLKKPVGSDNNVDSIFSTHQKALSAIAEAYGMSLAIGIRRDDNRIVGPNGSTLTALSGEINELKFNWNDTWLIQRSGMTADAGSGRARSDDAFNFNFLSIRQNHLVLENIDKVEDLSEVQKAQIKAEMKVLTAYRYEEMFKRYGGVPIVTKTLSLEDDIKLPRASLQETLDHIIKLCDEAAAVLPDTYERSMQGRVTKGVALAVKAEALLFAARPLFNSATPHLDLGANNKLISFGNADPNRWQKAAEASKAVIDWALANGYEIIKTGSPLDDYGNAVATPGNKEVLLAYKDQTAFNTSYDPRQQGGGANGMSFYQLSQYVKADGTEQTWAGTTPESFATYVEKMEQMEPRYKASAMAAGIDAWNNPNDANWRSSVLTNGSNWEGRAGNEACGRRVKFWYRAGTRTWFEYPIYRLAEFYLNLAEAYNELNQPAEALKNLNVTRQRGGLPDIAETNKDLLRKAIQREWAVEFYEENHKLYDAKHWKLADIANGIIGGPKRSFIFTYKNGKEGFVVADYLAYSTQVVYNGFWAPNQYLSPFPIGEINKGYLVQNPGY